MAKRAEPAKTTPKKPKYHHGDLRAALIDASLKIIATEGAEALTLRSAAREAGVSHAAPYAHFEDKEDLVAAVKDEGFKELQQILSASLAALPDDSETRVAAMAVEYLRFAAEQPAKYTVMFRRPLAKTPRPTFTYIETGREVFKMLAAEVAAMVAKKKGTPAFRPELITMVSWSALHGLCALWNDGPMMLIAPEGTKYDDLAKMFVAYLLQAIEKA